MTQDHHEFDVGCGLRSTSPRSFGFEFFWKKRETFFLWSENVCQKCADELVVVSVRCGFMILFTKNIQHSKHIGICLSSLNISIREDDTRSS